MISAILCHNQDHVIGLNDQLPWNHDGDLKRFFRFTSGKALLMGVRTYLGIAKFYSSLDTEVHLVLPNRKIFVIGEHRDVPLEMTLITETRGCRIDLSNVFAITLTTINDAQGVIKQITQSTHRELVICGGSSIYDKFLEFASVIILTVIDYPVIAPAAVKLTPHAVDVLSRYDRKFIKAEIYNKINASYYELTKNDFSSS